jgi:thiol-disulfide isomerase/thioredoxin
MVALKNYLLPIRFLTVACAVAWSSSLWAADIMLLDFGSAACAPCQEMRPVVQRLAAAGYRVRYVDIARESALAAQFKVDQVPTFVALVDGREHARLVGTGTYEQLQQMLAPRGAVRGQSPLKECPSDIESLQQCRGEPSGCFQFGQPRTTVGSDGKNLGRGCLRELGGDRNHR